MTDDLTARLERALDVQEQHEADLQPDAAALADLHRSIARGRRARATSYAAVAAASAAVLVVAGWFGLQDRTPPQPAVTPAPSASPSPSPTTPTPTPTPPPTPTPSPLVPVTVPGLPPMYEAPEGILEQTGPGWFVAYYQLAIFEAVPGFGEPHVLVLSAPTGELYHLTDVADHVTPVRWVEPGSLRAVARVDGVQRAATVDLRTGEVVVDERLPQGTEWVGMHGDDEVWAVRDGDDSYVLVVPAQGGVRQVPAPPGEDVSLSPDGLRVAFGFRSGLDDTTGVVDLGTGEVLDLALPRGQQCWSAGWLDVTGVLAVCADRLPEGTYDMDSSYLDRRAGRVVRLDATSGEATTLRELEPGGVVPQGGAHVREGVVVVTDAPVLSGDDCAWVCFDDAYLWSGDGETALEKPGDPEDAVCDVGVTGSGILLMTVDFCYEERGGANWWLRDDATGAYRLVAPAGEPEGGIAPTYVVERS